MLTVYALRIVVIIYSKRIVWKKIYRDVLPLAFFFMFISLMLNTLRFNIFMTISYIRSVMWRMEVAINIIVIITMKMRPRHFAITPQSSHQLSQHVQ